MSIDVERSLARLQKISLELEELGSKVAPLLVRIGHLRKEASVIEQELADEERRREVQEA